MSDLFSDAARERIPDIAPLPLRLRPRTLDEFVGQEHVLGEGSALRLAIAEDRVRSMILYGPPGSGKTTLARIVANMTGAAFEELSAVSATVLQVREVIAARAERLGAQGQRTILFLDEIHRFNKAQQDALLPAVEEGVITLIGATTENPYFEVNSALLSRTQLYTLEPHDREDLALVAQDASELGVELPDEVDHARRRARRRRCAQRARHPGARGADGASRRASTWRRVTSRTLDEAPARVRQGRRPALRLHLGLHQVDARVRRGRQRLLPRGDARGRRDPRYIARRMIVLASEDIGNADPRALRSPLPRRTRSSTSACRRRA